MLREKRTNLWPGASDNVHALLRPLGNAWARHVSQVDIELRMPAFSNSSANSSTASCSGSFAGRTTTSRVTVLSKSTAKCFKTVEGFGTAFATVAHVLILDRDAPVRCDVLFDTSPARSTPRVWLGVLHDKLRDGLHDLLQRRCLSQGVLLLQPALPPFHLLQDQAQRAGACAGLPPIQVQCRLRLLCPTSVSPASSTSTSADVSNAWAARPTALRSAWPSRFNVSSTRPAPNSGVESKTARSCLAPKPPVCSANATVRSSRVLSKLWVMSRIRKLNRVP